VVNDHLIRKAGLDVVNTPVIGLVVESKCQFMKEISFPQTVHAGMRVVKLGNSSVTYQISLFRDDEDSPAAIGHFVHVYVDRKTRATVRVPDQVRDALAELIA
jgi:acyl-CoA thioester hydrolase